MAHRHVGLIAISICGILAGCLDQPLPGLGHLPGALPPGQATDRNPNLQDEKQTGPKPDIVPTDGGTQASASARGLLVSIAGNGKSAFSGDGTLATAASLAFPSGLALGTNGNLFVSDSSNQRIRRIASGGTIDTLVEGLNRPSGLTVDASGAVIVADTGSHSVKKAAQGGNLDALATQALNSPQGVAVDKHGNVYVADSFNNRIQKISAEGTETTFAGTGIAGFTGDGGPATEAQLNHPWGLTIDSAGNLYVADTWNHRIRVIRTNGNIETVAGSGPVGEDKQGFSGDGGKATEAILNKPVGVALDHKGNLFICDMDNTRIRVVRTNGIIETVAGGGSKTGDNVPATEASLTWPQAIAVDKDGNLYIADSGANKVYKVVFP